MKKLLSFVIVLLFWTTYSNAVVLGKYLKKKDYTQYMMYNQFIEDYNNFKKNFNEEVLRYCNKQMVEGAGVNQIIRRTTCEYNAVVDLLEKNELNIKSMSDITYSWYKNAHAMAKSTAIGVHACSRKSCKYNLIDKWERNDVELKLNLIKRLDEGVKKIALEENRKYYAKKEEEKNQGIEVADDEIVAASSGTGFFVSSSGHLVSNFHVIDGCSNVKLFYNDKEIDTETLAVDKKNDLAILKVNIKPKKIYAVSTEDAQLLEDVIVAGYPLGKNISEAIKASSGTITALAGVGDNYSEFQTDAALNSGNSGGPILDQKGNVVGVAVSKIQAEGVEGFNFGIKSSVLRIFANANNIELLPQKNRPMNKRQLRELITNATVYLDCWMTGKKLKELLAENQNSKKAFYSKFFN